MITFLVYASFQQAFGEIGRIASEKRIVFVIDEYPYLAKVDPTISSRLQHLIDLIGDLVIDSNILERSNIWNRYLQSFRI